MAEEVSVDKKMMLAAARKSVIGNFTNMLEIVERIGKVNTSFINDKIRPLSDELGVQMNGLTADEISTVRRVAKACGLNEDAMETLVRELWKEESFSPSVETTLT